MDRVERKYLISSNNVIELKYRLKSLLKLDNHVNSNGYYHVRSLYFDDVNDTCLNQVLDGINYRYKYRIRLHDFDENYIVLEKKIKRNNISKKLSCKISKQQVIDIINNNNLIVDRNNPKLLNELYLMMKMNGLRPVVIIDYKRIPYVYDCGNIRITMDYDIYCSNQLDQFFSDKIIRLPLLCKNEAILEIKYTNIFPDFIRYMLGFNELYCTSFSKYKNSRLVLKNYNGGI